MPIHYYTNTSGNKTLVRALLTPMERRAHNSWIAMRNRCKRSDAGFADIGSYFAKGIKVCDQWQDDFEQFLEDMGTPPSEAHSIERQDNDKGYSPENCVWASAKEQMENRCSTVWITAGNETKTLAEWSRQVGISPATITRRLERGATPENAVKPLGKYEWNSYRPLTINGVTKHVSQWARELGITPEGLSYRIKKGLKDDDLIRGRALPGMRDLSQGAPTTPVVRTAGRPPGSKNKPKPQVNPPTENSPLTDAPPAPH